VSYVSVSSVSAYFTSVNWALYLKAVLKYILYYSAVYLLLWIVISISLCFEGRCQGNVLCPTFVPRPQPSSQACPVISPRTKTYKENAESIKKEHKNNTTKHGLPVTWASCGTMVVEPPWVCSVGKFKHYVLEVIKYQNASKNGGEKFQNNHYCKLLGIFV